jgi:sugar lactone lactonase YvrE
MKPIKLLAYLLCLGAVLVMTGPAQTNRANQDASRRPAELQRALTAFASWAKRHATRTGTIIESQTLEEGIRLAKQRRIAFAQLMQSNPAQAISATIQADLRKSLPSKIQDEVEEPVYGTGDLLVICVMPSAGAQGTGGIQRLVRLNGLTYRAVVYGRRLGQTTKYQIPVHGVALDGVLVLNEEVLAELPREEISKGIESIDLSAAAGPLASPGSPVLARLGERVYRFASAAHLKHSEALLENAESAPLAELGESAATLLERARFPEAELKSLPRPLISLPEPPKEIKALLIRVDFSDMPGDPSSWGGNPVFTATAAQNVADDEISPYYQSSSYGRVKLTFTVTPQLYRLPRTAEHYAINRYEFQLYNDAVEAATQDYAVTNYDKVTVLFSWLGFIPNSQIQFGGETLVGTPESVVNGEFDFRVVAHELGHTFGLQHANFWQTSDTDAFSDNGSSIGYGDVFDTMSANFANDHRVDFNPWFKYRLGWIGDDQVQTITDPGIYRVYRFDDAHASGTLALKVTKDATRDYWIAYRRNFANNYGLQHGAYVIWGYHDASPSNLLGLGSELNKAIDPGLELGSALADPQANVTIVPVSQGGDAPNEYLDVQVLFAPPPIITRHPDPKISLEGLVGQFSVQVAGNPSYAWQRRASGTGDWVTLTDDATYSGTTSDSLQINSTTALMNGDCFRCLLTNSVGGYNSSRPACLTVNAFGVMTLAGQPGVPGQADGSAADALFNSPMGLSVDAAGNTYVADTGNHVIRRITPGGVVSSLAGLAGNPGSADGQGIDGRFNSPMGLAVDSSGSVYVADQANSTIRKITPYGVVTTLAGLAGVTGAADGFAGDARFNHPAGLAVDCAGTVYVADTGNNTIRIVSPEGAVSTVAGSYGNAGIGDGAGSSARFSSPFGIAVDIDGTIYVADQGNSTIRKVSHDGIVTTFAGTAGSTGGSDGLGAKARFNHPAGLAIDLAGTVYVSDRDDSTIRSISPAGVVSTLAGSSGTKGIADGAANSALLSNPTAVAVDALGMVYVADTAGNTIRVIRSAVPQPPTLRMNLAGGKLVLSWPAELTGFVLETRNDWSATGAWVPVTNDPTVVGCSLMLTNDLSQPAGFFRLHQR